MSKALDEAKHHFIIELDSEGVYGSMKCNHKDDEDEFAAETHYDSIVCAFKKLVKPMKF